MDFAHGVLLLLIGLPLSFLVFAIILWAETPKKEKEKYGIDMWWLRKD